MRTQSQSTWHWLWSGDWVRGRRAWRRSLIVSRDKGRMIPQPGGKRYWQKFSETIAYSTVENRNIYIMNCQIRLKRFPDNIKSSNWSTSTLCDKNAHREIRLNEKMHNFPTVLEVIQRGQDFLLSKQKMFPSLRISGW